MNEHKDTATEIIEVAQELMQTRGYNAFSYADIAERIGIRKASIHYYFPSKSSLALAAVVRYRATHRANVSQIEHHFTDPAKKLEVAVISFGRLLYDKNRLCLCGMLAAEMPTLPDEVRDEVLGYFKQLETELTALLTEGVNTGTLHVPQPIEEEARFILASMEGMLMVARAFNDPARYEAAARQLLTRYIKSE